MSEKEDDDKIGCGPAMLIVISVMALTFLITGAIVQTVVDNSWRDQIVSHGGAEYYLDAKHERQWRWK